MKFKASQKQLQLACKAASKCLSRRPHLPVLGGINLRVADDRLTIMVTDLTAGLKISLPVTDSEAGEATINGKNLVETINFFEAEQTSVEVKENQVLLKNGKDRVQVSVMTDAFPDFQLVGEATDKKPLAFWETLVKKVAFAAGTDQSRPALTGILLKTSAGQTQIVCTDGFRLAIWQPGETLIGGKDLEVIVAAKAITDMVAIAQIMEEKEVGLIFDETGEQLLFIGERLAYFSKLINATYPPFEKIVPPEFATEVTLDRELLAKNLNKASVFTRADSNTVKLSIDDDKVSFAAVSLGDGSFAGEQEIMNKTGDGLEISFNIRYLLDFMNTCTGEAIWCGFNGPLSPAMLKDPTDNTMKYIAMPFKPKIS